MAKISNQVMRVFRPMNYLRFIQWGIKKIKIFSHSRSINRKLTNSKQRGLFLDCGSNVGQGFEFFRKYYPISLFDYVLFEPNPNCFQVLAEKYSDLEDFGVELRNEAIGIENGQIDFYGLEDHKGGIYSVGGTVLPEHNSGIYSGFNNASLQVPSMNFSEFLIDLFDHKDYQVIILKLDIEGAEYSILDSLISNELIPKFETIYVEFHSQYMSSEFSDFYQNKEKMFMEYSKNTRTRVIKWV